MCVRPPRKLAVLLFKEDILRHAINLDPVTVEGGSGELHLMEAKQSVDEMMEKVQEW